jgi:hypothetical protein
LNDTWPSGYNASLRKVGEQAFVEGSQTTDKDKGEHEAEEFANLKIAPGSGLVGGEDVGNAW